jgi:hypothetical protein
VRRGCAFDSAVLLASAGFALDKHGGICRRDGFDLAKTAVIAPALAGKLGGVSLDDYSPQVPLELMKTRTFV